MGSHRAEHQPAGPWGAIGCKVIYYLLCKVLHYKPMSLAPRGGGAGKTSVGKCASKCLQ